MTIGIQTLYYGHDQPLPEQLHVWAGALRLMIEHGTVRHVRIGNQPILHHVYAAVRDHNWGTVEPVFSDVHLTQTADSFQMTFTARHTRQEIDFSWRGTITGTSDSTLIFTFDGEAHSDFLRNRIGFCVLHPATCAGLPCEIEHVDGRKVSGVFPRYILPYQPFSDLRAITFAPLPSLPAEVIMEGDTFEMEDQRNWTDASFKTYCTPLRLPFPVQIKRGDRISQKITLRLLGTPPAVTLTDDALKVTISERRSRLPHIGLSCANGQGFSMPQAEVLRMLNLAHLRLELDLHQPDSLERLTQGLSEASRIGTQLEIALFLSDHAQAELEHLATQLRSVRAEADRAGETSFSPVPTEDLGKLPIVRWLIFGYEEKATRPEWVRLARELLAPITPNALFGGGTDAFFTELNRNRPPVELFDFLSFSTNPQVHAFDNLSLVETLPIHGDLIASARQFAANRPICVSPITLKMRWNPNATGAEPPTEAEQLPRRVDVRQMSLFGAGWTLGNLKYFAEADVHSLTYYELVGWLGVMERHQGSPLPDKFQSYTGGYAGGVYPMYHVFADVGEFAGGEVWHTTSSDPLRVLSLMLHQDGKHRLLLANLTPHEQTVTISINGSFTVKTLDETTAEFAMLDPYAFHESDGETLVANANGLTVVLRPYALLRLDQAS